MSSTFSDDLARELSAASRSAAWAAYQRVLPLVKAMLDEAAAQAGAAPSAYWQDEIAGFDYLFDASPLVARKIREHCFHVTGQRSYDYRGHHAHQAGRFAQKLAALQALDRRALFVPESPELGGFGHHLPDGLVNLDTLKFYECLIALDRGGALDAFASGLDRQVALEIGAGWGGFAHAFRSCFPNTTYVIVDLPATLLFSGTYLLGCCPDARVFVYGEGDVREALHNATSYDFMLLPHFAAERLQELSVDLAVNMVSFQELTSAQVERYARVLHAAGCNTIYSLNRDRSPHNRELSTVSGILSQYYDLTEVPLLPVPYTTMLPRDAREAGADKVLNVLRWLAGRGRVRGRSVDEYRHLVGRRRTAPLPA